MNNSNHAYDTIRFTISQLLNGSPYIPLLPSEFIVDYTTSVFYSCGGSTSYFAGYDPSVAVATSSTATTSTSPVAIKEKLAELQGKLIMLLKQLVVLLTEQLQNVVKTTTGST